MQTTLEVAICDDRWPKLRIVCRRTSSIGETSITDQAVLYDQANVQFETQLTNHLRPMVQEIINLRRKR